MMLFNIGKTQIRITFFFAAGLALFSLQADINTFFSVLTAVVLHELTHCIFVYRFAGAPQRITVGLFGMCMTDEKVRLIGYKKEALCALTAPLVNIVCFVFLFCLSFLFPALKTAAAVHFSLGICNLLPLRCLDGGRGLQCLLYLRYPQAKAERMMDVTEWIFFFVMWIVLCVYMYLVKPTLSAVVFLFYLTFLFLFRK
ncbi:MAG: hypothetical protein IKM24_01250 [Clostridia bacterium]|nr:hypothetical protein [Clostridia bacterium]